MVEFEKMAGEAIYLMEPGVEFSLVYETSGEGSLRIITLLRGVVTRDRLKTLAIILTTTLFNNAVGHFQGKAMDEVVEALADENTTLTDEDIARIAEAVSKIERSETVKTPRREFFKAVEQDQAISGVAAVPNDKDKRPEVIVPRDEFLERATRHPAIENEDVAEPRVVPERLEVVLVQPPLIDSNRQWKLFANGHEFGAKMLDERFKHQILEGTTDLRLAGGVILDVTLEVTQVNEGGLWYNKSYAVTEVHSWRQNPQQADLLLAHGSDDDEQDDQNDNKNGPR
ncbi:hypothetical protein [Ruegeria atlantica]|uniref:hypothetical protein n=1 Tax=Ruegeria atlantica TaxID=81569 RepID=UPI0014798DCA|nr:hypothetical protein [Ruegeria atlantica]